MDSSVQERLNSGDEDEPYLSYVANTAVETGDFHCALRANDIN